jgi:hypothetical protein
MAALLPVLLTPSCDVIQNGDYLIPVELPAAKKKILIEDYTGMKCPNCPDAARIIDSLKVAFGDTIIAVSIHAGCYSTPSGIFTADFRTEAGTTYNNDFSIDSYPTGLINRNVYKNMLKLNKNEWNGAVLQQIIQESSIGIEILNTWSAETRNLNISVEVSVFNDLTNNLKLQIWLVEDSIIAPQMCGPDIVNNYVHRHVFRSVLNGTWGEDLSGVIKDAVLKKTLNYQLPGNFKAERCEVIAFVYVKDDKSVLQVNASQVKK